MYTAVVLTEESRKDLLEVYKEALKLPGFVMRTANGDPLLHHVTVNMGGFDEKLNPKSNLGKEIVMNVVTFASDYRVAAFGVDFVKVGGKSCFGTPLVTTINDIPHITAMINLKEGGKPFYSNQLTDWKQLDQVVEVRGVLEVVT